MAEGVEMKTLIFVLLFSSNVLAQSVVLTWNDTNTQEQGYAIERRLESGSIWTEITRTGVNAVTYTDTTAVAGTRYCYRARAFAVASYSAYSSPDACMLATPTGATVTIGP